MYKKTAWVAAIMLSVVLAACSRGGGDKTAPPQATPPNILFIVLDDLGVDQLEAFGYGGGLLDGAVTAPRTPNIDAIARAGIRFRNTWSMPTCSPTRAGFFEGRYPSRTGVKNAILALDLANAQVSPFEATTPKLLKAKGYVNAMVGKVHVSGSDQNPANHPLGYDTMRELGWDHFEGYHDGAPWPIDTTAGGIGDATGERYACGFVPSRQDDAGKGADAGACYGADGSCRALARGSSLAEGPGQACLAQGGIFDPGQACQAVRPAYVDFSRQNGYYTAQWIINRQDGSTEVVPASEPASRGYRTTQETDRAVRWIGAHQASSDRPWMMSVGYSAIHTPLQPPPASLVGTPALPLGGADCGALLDGKAIAKQMIEALDTEIGRLLTGAGLARRRADGTLDYRPELTRTVVAIVGDNGTFAPTVRLPFDAARSKGTAYQSGVWVPLIVAGPMVAAPDRDVEHMVNTTDLYRLFAELAGIDLDTAVPRREVDAEPVLPYLTEPGHDAIRAVNFTEMGRNLTASTATAPPPCVLPALNMCVQAIPQKMVCEDQGGVWYGPEGAAGQQGLSSCCAVNAYLAERGEAEVELLPDSQKAVRNAFFKLVRTERLNCGTGRLDTRDELYAIDQAVPRPRLDRAGADLLDEGSPAGLAPPQREQYETLVAELARVEGRNATCPGDGNGDLVVDAEDLAQWAFFSTHNGGRSSWYDFNADGLTDAADRAVIEQHLGRDCARALP